MILSPLRYPGGKAKLFGYFVSIIKRNQLYGATYCEPYAGGAGLALKLLSTGFVSRVILNDIDPSIYAFWKSTLHNTDNFCRLIDEAPVTIEEWYRQKLIWQDQNIDNMLELGFATFFLNRTNRSGIIEGAGPIGGYEQAGSWKLNVRFNKNQLIQQIKAISMFKNQIILLNSDAIDCATKYLKMDDVFCYLDPPYYVKGSKLYRNFYNHDDHCAIHSILLKNKPARWVVSYDDVPQIRRIYGGFEPISYSLSYTAGAKSTGREVIFFSDSLFPPVFPGFTRVAA